MHRAGDGTNSIGIRETLTIYYTTKNKIVIAAALLVAALGFVLAVVFTAEPDSDVTLTGASAAQGQPGEALTIVERYVPGRGVEALQQAQVGLDLAAGWALTDFTLNNVAIPDAELDITSELDLYVFTPGDGQTVEALDPQTNCASATVFRISDEDLTGTRTERWCFEVL